MPLPFARMVSSSKLKINNFPKFVTAAIYLSSCIIFSQGRISAPSGTFIKALPVFLLEIISSKFARNPYPEVLAIRNLSSPFPMATLINSTPELEVTLPVKGSPRPLAEGSVCAGNV